MAVSGDLSSAVKVRNFAEELNNCWFACGVHPHEADAANGDFSGFADAVMDGAGGLDGPFKTLVCEFKEGMIVRADLLYELEAYGIRWESLMVRILF